MKKISVFIQLVLIMFVLSAIPAIGVIYFNSVNLRERTENTISESAVNKLKANKELGDEVLTNIVYDAVDIVLARQYSDLAGAKSYEILNSDYDYVNAAMKIKTSLSDFADRNKLVKSIYYYIDGADYTISSKGFSKLSEGNFEWLMNSLDKVTGIQSVWYPQRIAQSNKSSVDVVSYLYRSTSLYTSSKVTIIINLYEKQLSNLISSESENNQQGFLVNKAGEIIVHTNKEYLYRNVSKEDYIKKILTSKKRSGYEINEKANQLYAYVKSDLYDWTYVNVYSLDYLYEQSNQIISSGVVTTLIIILFGAVCSVMVSLRISHPLRKLTNEIRSISAGIDSDIASKNEIEYLTGAFGKIKEKTVNLTNSLHQSEVTARHVAVRAMLNGDSLPEKELSLVENYFVHGHFIVCIIALDKFIDYQEKTPYEIRKKHRELLQTKIRDVFPENYVLDCERYNAYATALLLNFKVYDSVQVKMQLEKLLQEVQKYYISMAGESFTVGISQVHNSFSGIKECVDEGLEAAKKRLLLGENRIIFFRPGEHLSNLDSYPFERRIINNLEIGNLDGINAEINALAQNIKNTTNISVDNVMLIYNTLIGDIISYLNKNNYNTAAVFGGSQSSLYVQLAEKETIDAITCFLNDIFLSITNFQIQETDEEKDYTKIIITHIKQHYNEDIDFEKMSKDIGISYSYARKIVKNETGKSILDNLNYIRIQEVKRLLDQEGFSIAEISSYVGYNNVQSLYRMFKKFEGVSPRDYSGERKDFK